MDRSDKNYSDAVEEFNRLFTGEDSAVGKYKQLCDLLYQSTSHKNFEHLLHQSGTDYHMLGYLHDAIEVYQLRKDGLEKEKSRLITPESDQIRTIRNQIAELKTVLADETFPELIKKSAHDTAEYLESLRSEIRPDGSWRDQDKVPDMVLNMVKHQEKNLLVLQRIGAHKEEFVHAVDLIESKLNGLQETVPFARTSSADDLYVDGYWHGTVLREYGGARKTKVDSEHDPVHGDVVWEMTLGGVGGIRLGGNNLFLDYSRKGKQVNVDFCVIDDEGKAWRFNAGAKNTWPLEGANAQIDELLSLYRAFTPEDAMTFDKEGFVAALKAKLPEFVAKYPPRVNQVVQLPEDGHTKKKKWDR